MTSHPEFVQRRKHIDRKLLLLDSPFLRRASVSPCKLVLRSAGRAASNEFLARWGEGEGGPGSTAGHRPGHPHRGPRAPGPETGRGPLHRPYEDCSTSCELIGYPAGDSLVRLSALRQRAAGRAQRL